MYDYDVIIIGAGILGCMIARNISKYNLNVLVLEKENDVSCGITKANSAIIYPGIDNKINTFKGKIALKSAQNFDSLCKELSVNYSSCGALFVCYGENGYKSLEKKYQNALFNGLNNISILNKEQILEMNPSISDKVYRGFFYPNTKTILPWELCIAAYENAKNNKVNFLFNSKVLNIEPYKQGYKIFIKEKSFTTRSVINCGGLFSHNIRELLFEPHIRCSFNSATYLVYESYALPTLKHIIIEETENQGKGINVIPTIDGKILLGPSSDEIFYDEEIGKINNLFNIENKTFPTLSSGYNFINERIEKIFPSFNKNYQIRSFASIRPFIHFVEKINNTWKTTNENIKGFCIVEDGLESTIKNFISLIGIKTPGLTCANELSKAVIEKLLPALEDILKHQIEINNNFNPYRKKTNSFRNLSLDEKENYINEHKNNFEIICQCNNVTKYEVLQALKSGAVDFEGIKKRTSAGMGKCQSSRCLFKINKIIDEYKNNQL